MKKMAGISCEKKNAIPLLSGVVASLGARYLLGLGRSSSLISGIGVGLLLYWSLAPKQRSWPNSMSVATLDLEGQEGDEKLGKSLVQLQASALLFQNWKRQGSNQKSALESTLKSDGYAIYKTFSQTELTAVIALKSMWFEERKHNLSDKNCLLLLCRQNKIPYFFVSKNNTKNIKEILKPWVGDGKGCRLIMGFNNSKSATEIIEEVAFNSLDLKAVESGTKKLIFQGTSCIETCKDQAIDNLFVAHFSSPQT